MRNASLHPHDVHLPAPTVGPLRQIGLRILIALGVLVLMIALVYIDREGYNDNSDGSVGLLDAAYYSTVSLSTTGYGDIAPVSPTARLVNIFVITPLRVAFLIVLVGTTLEVLATRSRHLWRITRWRRRLRDHTVVVGYGTKGRSAVATLISGGIARQSIIVVDPSSEAVTEANDNGLAGVVGDATRADVLRRAEIETAGRIIITAHRDDTAILVTLTARRHNPDAPIVVAVRESENIDLLRQSGADSVVTSSESVGRILGLSTVSPALGTVLEDLLTYGVGLEVAERPVLPREEGKAPRQLDDVVVGVVRDGEVYRYFDPSVSQLLRGDQVVVIRSAEELPWARRPGAEDAEVAAEDDGDSDDPEDDAGAENPTIR